MSRRSRARVRRRVAAAILLSMLPWTSAPRGQEVTEPSLKAALIYNFAKFTEWPRDVLAPGASPFNACVLGDAVVAEALVRTVKGRLLFGHAVTVSPVTLEGPLRSCHLLYVAAVTAVQATETLAAVRGTPVLTIMDIEGSARGGGIAQVFVERGQIRFDLDHGLAKRGRLQLSSKLLTLATHVYDEPERAAP
jgi:hypothetical protein